MIAVAVLMLSAVTAFAQNSGGYKILNGKVYYKNVILHEADPNTIQDLGYGYAKDNENVWFEGKILPLVDPHMFRLKHTSSPSGPVPPHHRSEEFGLDDLLSVLLGNGSSHDDVRNPDHGPNHDHGNMHQERGYEIVGNKVYYNGVLISNAYPHSFKDLGWGYAVDTFDVYYCGEEIDASTMNFTVLADGYAKNSFDVFYFGKEVEGASANSFKVLRDGYAEDAFDTYYRGVEIDD